MYGWRLSVGLLLPAPNIVLEPEFYKIAPKGVAIYSTRMTLTASYDAEALIAMAEHAERGASELAQAGVDIIAYGCTSGSFVKGVGHDLELAKTIERAVNIPTITTSTAVLDALKLLDIKKVAVATPYTQEVTLKAKSFLEGNGFEVTNIKGMEITTALEIGQKDPHMTYRFIKNMTTRDADGIAVLCTNLRTIDIIDMLEKYTGKPVVTANQATIAMALHRMNVSDKITGYGQLFQISK